MQEYRFTGVNTVGAPIRGNIFAPTKRAAQKRIETLADEHEFQAEQVERRLTFLYKVRHPDGETVRGEQKAYSKQEVRAALERMGLEVLSVQRKLIEYQFKPSTSDLVVFVRLSANMLKRKLPFDEVLALLVTDTSNAALRQTIRDLSSDLKSGVDAQQAFLKHQHVLGKFTAFILGLAATSGNMAEMFEAAAKYLERKDEYRKQVRSALIMPTVTILATIAACLWYVWELVPAQMELFSDFSITLPILTKYSLMFAEWMDQNYLWLFILMALVTVGTIMFARTTRGQFLIHKYMIKIPILGPLFHKLNLETFCRVFSVLYGSSGENEEIMKISAEATGNTYIEHQVKTVTIPMMMARGTDLIKSMHASKVFLPMMLARFRSGAETGSVRDSAEEMAEFYERETKMRMEMTLTYIRLFVAGIITLAVAFLTILAMETAFMMPSGSEILTNSPI